MVELMMYKILLAEEQQFRLPCSRPDFTVYVESEERAGAVEDGSERTDHSGNHGGDEQAA